jgi:Fe-Mn family superoxide dismutase
LAELVAGQKLGRRDDSAITLFDLGGLGLQDVASAAEPVAADIGVSDEAAALDSTLLHELYFASLGGDGRAMSETIAAAFTRDFGSVDRWRREFMALAGALAGG